MTELVVINPFLTYEPGDVITDAGSVAAALASYPGDVTVFAGSGQAAGQEFITLSVSYAEIGSPILFGGALINGSTTSISYQVNGAGPWVAATEFMLSLGAYTALGPTLTAGDLVTLQVRDTLSPNIVSNIVTTYLAPAGSLGAETTRAVARENYLQTLASSDLLTGSFQVDSSGDVTLTTAGSPIVLSGFVQALFSSLPTSAAGLTSGKFYLNQGVVQQVP